MEIKENKMEKRKLQNHLHARPWDNYTWMLFSKDFQVSEFKISQNFYQIVPRTDDFNHFKITCVKWAIFLGSLGTGYFWGLVISHLGVWTEKVQSLSWYSVNTAWNPKRFKELKEYDVLKWLIKKFCLTQNIKEWLSSV